MATGIALPRDLGSYFPTIARHPFPFLLESAGTGRFSYLGSHPYAVLTARGDRISIWREGHEKTFRQNPFDVIESMLAERPIENDRLLPFPGGAVGAFGYDLAHHLEKLPHRAEDDLDFPDLVLGFYDRLVMIDHQEQRAQVVELSDRARKRAIDAWDKVAGPAHIKFLA